MTDIIETKIERWSPEAGQAVWMASGAEPPVKRSIALEQMELRLPVGGGEPQIALKFTASHQDYLAMEADRWFDIPVGFSERAAIAFDTAKPIQFEVETKPAARGGYPLSASLAIAKPGQELDKLRAPFLNKELSRMPNDPLIYEIVRVSQGGGDGHGVGFTRKDLG
ncbi:MAG: hypothetical protein ACI9MR_005154 [Myxococcota bacterium]|jgi:hypothetical protein